MICLFFKKILFIALVGVAQWIECWPANQRATGSIPSLGHMPGFWARSPVRGTEEATTIDVSLPLFLPPFPLSFAWGKGSRKREGNIHAKKKH